MWRVIRCLFIWMRSAATNILPSICRITGIWTSCDVTVKRFLNSVLQEELEPIRQRRKEIAKDIPAVYRILEEGSKKARAKASETLADMKRAMKINYFEDMELIEEQARRFNAEV